ncbi:type VI secretion system Vgr family protein [Enterobacter vonholyi]|uniref:type VI secretion system Vgr family protein n=1 Tax=Enterobacter vonholyi TaxID=2797505 RepID=UPI00349EF11D
MAGQSDTVQYQDTLNRYLLYFPRNKTVLSDVLSFSGEEELSKPYRYTIRFTSSTPNIAVKDVLNQMAEFILRAPNPRAGWHHQDPWLPVRQINGVITSFSRLKSSADETLYECVLEHELALMDRNYRSAVYMDMTVPELVTKLMKDSGYFQGYNIDFDQLGFSYPLREMVIQWKETDLQFIRRLLAEVGIWFRFENHDKVPAETVVIFGDGGRRYVFSDKKLPYVPNSGMTSHEEYVTELEERYQLIPENVLVRTYNYRDPFSPQADKTLTDNDIPDGIIRGKQYHYADHFLSEGDFYGQEAETATFYARLRYERLLNNQSVLGVTTSDPELLPGVMFNLTGDIPAGFKPGFVVTTMTLSGSRAEHYRAVLKGIPYLHGYSYRPDYLPRPVIAGTVPGRVAAINRDPTYAGVDAQGRYRVKFDFDLDEKRDGFESALMRLGRPYGGDVFGFHFPLLDGTEVAVAFEGGDPDRPYIAHVMHDGSHPDLVTNRNDTRNVIRTAASNKIRLEDRRGEEHIKISTEHGKGQVSVGHLVDATGKKRGQGVEARTDDWMALRAAKGVLITTEAQPRAQGQQLDMTAAIAQLEKALSLAMTLQQSALTAGAGNVDTDQQNQLARVLNQLTGPGILAYAEKGAAHVTPQSLQLSAGKDLIATAGQDASVNVVKKFSLTVGEKLSLFVRKLGIQMIAGAGDITTQAQRGAMHMLSQKDFTMASTAGQLNGSAKQGIQLVCGGGGIRVSPNGLVTIFSPTGIELKGPNLKYDGPESAQVTVPPFNKGAFKFRYQLHAGDDPEQILANKKFRLTSSAGNVVEGVTDSNGHSSLLDADDLDTYKMELL